jgi:glycosyltransferase involved in cell wall biosynthesis
MRSAGRAEEAQVAVVHDYFTQRGGAERVAAHLAGLYPGAPVFAALVAPEALPEGLGPAAIRTTSLQRLGRAGLPLRSLAPLLPAAFGRLDIGRPGVVVSSSSAFAHHIRPPVGTAHVCYCHTPPRFLWSRSEYFRDQPGQARVLAPALGLLRRWDIQAAGRVDIYLANSAYTAERIRVAYGRPARVVYPPIETAAFVPSTERNGRFLVVARLRRHKRIDLAIHAANALALPLDIIGEGSERVHLAALAGPTVRFLGRRSGPQVAGAMARCAGLLVPGIEDFGMTTAEVQAAGRPPIAYAEGGATEIVDDGRTGFLFSEPTPAALGAAMERAIREPIEATALVESAQRFDATIFDAAIREIVSQALVGQALAGRP